MLGSIVPKEELIRHRIPKHLWGASYTRILAWRLAREGLTGKVGAIAELADGAEGRPGVASEDGQTADPLTELLKEMRAESARRGPPEGMPTRKDTAETDEEIVQ